MHWFLGIIILFQLYFKTEKTDAQGTENLTVGVGTAVTIKQATILTNKTTTTATITTTAITTSAPTAYVYLNITPENPKAKTFKPKCIFDNKGRNICIYLTIPTIKYTPPPDPTTPQWGR